MIAGLALTIIQLAVEAYQTYQQADIAEDTALSNAEMARQAAEEAKRISALEQQEEKIAGKRLLASQKAAAGASGATLGSFGSVFAQAKTDTEANVEKIRLEGLAKYEYYMSLVEQYENIAESAKESQDLLINPVKGVRSLLSKVF